MSLFAPSTTDSIKEFERLRQAFGSARAGGDEDTTAEEDAAPAGNRRPQSNVSVRPLPPGWRPSRGSTEAADKIATGGAPLLRAEGSLRIEGLITSDVEASDTVRIEPGGRVEGAVRAVVVEVAGEVVGRIDCRDRLEVTGTGRVWGEIATGRLVVQPGGVIEGQVSVWCQRTEDDGSTSNGQPSVGELPAGRE